MRKGLRRMIKSVFIIPVYVVLAIEGFFGGFGIGKPKDRWEDVVRWIKK